MGQTVTEYYFGRETTTHPAIAFLGAAHTGKL